MIPIKSNPSIVGKLFSPDNLPKKPTVDYEMGGIALQDTSEGISVQQWRAWYTRADAAVYVESQSTPKTLIFEQDNITWLSFCFDQNMRWSAVYTLRDGVSYLRWYDSFAADYVVTTLDADIVTPFLTLDDKRPSMLSKSDIVLAYIKNQTVYVRVQRERFLIPHLWAEEIPKDWIIRNFGMSNKLRLQMEIR